MFIICAMGLLSQSSVMHVWTDISPTFVRPPSYAKYPTIMHVWTKFIQNILSGLCPACISSCLGISHQHNKWLLIRSNSGNSINRSSHLMKLCPSIATSTMFAKLLTSTLELCVISGGASTMKLHEQWLPRWSGHDSTIVTRSFTERPLETLVGFRGWSTRWRGWSRVPGSVITSRQFWLIYTGFQSRPGFDSKLPYRHSKHSPVLRLHRDHSGQAQRTVFTSTLLEPASPVELFVMWRRLFGTLSLFTWLTFHILWIVKKQLKAFLYSQAYRHWQSSSSAPGIQFIHILICFHWHMARHQLCIIIIIINRFSWMVCNITELYGTYSAAVLKSGTVQSTLATEKYQPLSYQYQQQS